MSDDWHELAVGNASFLVEKLGGECGDLQGLRELTVNSLQAIAALGSDAEGRIVWDLDWERFDASRGKIRKLAVLDTGTGMTPGEMKYYINHLAASGREQSRTANFGVGAKVAAGSRNPAGLEYRSWHDGSGALVRFMRHRDGRWGLEPQIWPDGRSDYWRPLNEAEQPWLLRGQTHGTQVVLLGESDRHDTTEAPPSVTEGRQQWVIRYLTSRFLELPAAVQLLVRERARNPREPGELQRVYGQRHHLDSRAEAAGTLELSDATVHWWVLDDDHRGRRREAGTWISTGHAAALLDGEIYDLLPQTRGGYQRLQDCGIRFAYERVVIYVESQAEAGRLEATTSRSTLLLDHEPLPWARWGEEFAAVMPDEILELQERAANREGASRQDAIRSRITPLARLYHLTPYRPVRNRPAGRPRGLVGEDAPAVEELATPAAVDVAAGGHPNGSEDGLEISQSVESQAASSENATADAEDNTDREPSGVTKVDLPDVAWISWRDGSRAAGDLEDEAARYHPARHELTINADFRAIKDLISFWQKRYDRVPGARPLIEAHVSEYCEQILVEVVLAARSSHWDDDRLGELLSPISLTAALLPRQLLHAVLQKRLAQKLGPAPAG
jgi:hypothetical protein